MAVLRFGQLTSGGCVSRFFRRRAAQPSGLTPSTPMSSSPKASIIIPAYNEGTNINRCLDTLLKGATEREFEIVVVCNGCSDDTAERARSYETQGVRVLETPVASKVVALNLGDGEATAFPRFYVDADIRVPIAALREVVQLLNDHPEVLLAAPPAEVDFDESDPFVRAYYRVWTQLPYFTESMVGSGIFAFSRLGRERFDKFPEIIADDEYARRMVRPEERRTSSGSHFTISAPRTLRSLLNVNTRVRAGMYQLDDRFPELSQNRGTDPGRTLRVIAANPRLWLDAPVYLGIMFLAKLAGKKKLSGENAMRWNRDETARTTR